MYKKIVNEGIKGKTASQLVDLIFTQNPSDVAAYYQDQKEIYALQLINKNLACFVGDSCINDSLVTIPAFKKL